MDRDVLAELLQNADRQVLVCQRNVAHQQRVVAGLRRDGHDTQLAEALLIEFQNTETLQLANRDRLRAEMAGHDDPETGTRDVADNEPR
jgi:hypothetical protein